MTARQRVGVAALLVLAAALAFWLDQTLPTAAVWVLLVLSSSIGFAHGALDAALVLKRFRSSAAALLLAYLVLVFLLGWLLSHSPGLALWLLLLLSAWHFGEPYARWQGLSAHAALLTRLVVGGAPVMLPVWLGGDRFFQILQSVVSAQAVSGWQAMAAVWLGLLLLWVLLCGLRQPASTRFAWCEILATALLYGVFSPVMAFALYFGVYHAPVHVWRVWRAMTQPALAADTLLKPQTAGWAVTVALLATWLLSALLAWQLGWQRVGVVNTGLLLQWLIVALTALTVPHLVLISACAKYLSGLEPAIK